MPTARMREIEIAAAAAKAAHERAGARSSGLSLSSQHRPDPFGNAPLVSVCRGKPAPGAGAAARTNSLERPGGSRGAARTVALYPRERTGRSGESAGFQQYAFRHEESGSQHGFGCC
jgi:hypothetical protein